MESKHLSQKIRSSLLITLVFSYTGYLDDVTIILNSLSKAGVSFVENNLEQLRFFCIQHEKKIKEKFQAQTMVYFSNRITHIEKLVLSSITACNHLAEALQNVQSISKLQMYSQSQYYADILHVEMNALDEFLSRSSNVSFGTGAVPTFFQLLGAKPEKYQHLQGIAFDTCNFYKASGECLFQIINQIKELKIIGTSGLIIPKALLKGITDKEPSQIEKFQVTNQLEFIENCQSYWQINEQEFARMMSSFTPCLRYLSLTLSRQNFTKLFAHLGRLENLEEFKFRTDLFDIDVIEEFPSLKVLKLSYQKLEKKKDISTALQKINKLHLNNKDWFQDIWMDSKTDLTQDCEDLILLSTCSALRQLKLIGNQSLDRLFKNENNLQNLRLLRVTVMKEFYVDILAQVTRLRLLFEFKLTLKNDNFQNELDLSIPLNFQQNHSIEEVTLNFNCSFVKISKNLLEFVQIIGTFLSHLKSLRKLTENDRKLGLKYYKVLFPTILQQNNLKTLKILFNETQKNQTILQEIINNSTVLGSLELQNSLSSDDVKLLTPMLKKSPKLRILKLKSWPHRKGEEYLNILFKAVKVHPSLFSLDIGIDIGLKNVQSIKFKKPIGKLTQGEGKQEYTDICDFLINLESLVINTCQKLKYLRLQVSNHQYLLPTRGFNPKDPKLQKKEFLSNVSKHLPKLDILTI